MNKENDDLWFDKYEPLPNRDDRFTCYGLDGVSYSWDTHHDWDVVSRIDEKFIWTLLEVDGSEVISQGRHYVNRLAYFICRAPYEYGMNNPNEYVSFDYVNHVATRVEDNDFVYADGSYNIDEIQDAIASLQGDHYQRNWDNEIWKLTTWRGGVVING